MVAVRHHQNTLIQARAHQFDIGHIGRRAVHTCVQSCWSVLALLTRVACTTVYELVSIVWHLSSARLGHSSGRGHRVSAAPMVLNPELRSATIFRIGMDPALGATCLPSTKGARASWPRGSGRGRLAVRQIAAPAPLVTQLHAVQTVYVVVDTDTKHTCWVNDAYNKGMQR